MKEGKPMELIFFSDSIKSLNPDSIKTSSEKFEFELAFNLMLYENIKVSIYSSSLNYGERQKKSNLELIGIKGSTKRATFKNFNNLIGSNKDTRKIVIFYGYDLIKNIYLLYIKQKHRLIMLSFIFDTHIGAIEKFHYIKKFISNIYFKIAIGFLKFLDGYILFQEDAVKELNLKKPYYITKPGINKSTIEGHTHDISNQKTSNFTMSYLGSLMPYNGISELVHTFAMYDDADLRLRIFGTGKLRKEVIDYSKKDDRIYQGGLIDQNEIEEELKNADLLLNLRNPEHYVCKFAYPSKLIEYMGTGIPVLSTNLKFDDEIHECLYVINKLDPSEIYNKIVSIKEDSIENKRRKTQKAKEYILNNNDWKGICKELNSFLTKFL